MSSKKNEPQDNKEKQLSIAIRKSKQKAQLLIIQPDFIKKIKELRKKWKIPEKGFESHRSVNEWEDWFNEENRKYQQIEYPKFKKKYGDKSDYRYKLKIFEKTAPNNALQSDLEEIIQKLNLSPLLTKGLKSYLLVNKMPMFAGVIIEHSFESLYSSPVIKLIIQEDTSIKDISSIWKEIKQYQGQLPYWRSKKSQPIIYFERDKRAYELKQMGKTYKKIAIQLTEEFKTDFDYTQIQDFIKSHKKLLQIK